MEDRKPQSVSAMICNLMDGIDNDQPVVFENYTAFSTIQYPDPTTLDGSITDAIPQRGYSRAKLDRLMPPCVDGELPEGWRP